MRNEEVGALTTQTRPRGTTGTGSRTAGTVTLVLAVWFAVSVAWIFVLSLTGVVDAPNWVRATGALGLPVGLVGVPIGFAIARDGEGLERARAGVLVAAVALLALVGLVAALG